MFGTLHVPFQHCYLFPFSLIKYKINDYSFSGRWCYIIWGRSWKITIILPNKCIGQFSDTYIQKARKNYQDSRARRNLNRLNDELHDVQRIMVQNIDDVLQRGEQISGITADLCCYFWKIMQTPRKTCIHLWKLPWQIIPNGTPITGAALVSSL